MTVQPAQPRYHLPAGEDFLLLPPTMQAYAYRNVDRMFATRTIRCGPHALEMPRGLEIAPRYVVNGITRNVDAYMDRANIAGLLVIHDGAIRLERYGLGLTEDECWSSMSMVKSLTSTLIGAAVQDGLIGSLDDRVGQYVPALRSSAYQDVTIKHLITMSSGVRWNEDYTDRNSDVNRYSKSLGDKVPNGVLALLCDLAPLHPPGSRFNYNTGDTYLLGCLLTAATNKSLADYMSEKVWARLGMEFDAFYTLESEGGQEIGGSRAGIALRDFGRFGLLLLRDGMISGERLLPEGWMTDAATSAFRLDPTENSYGATGYGYSWWLDEAGAMVAVGFAGQSLYIDRQAGVVIVTLSCQPQPPYAVPIDFNFKTERQAFHAAILSQLSSD